jgi:hypothetical protein
MSPLSEALLAICEEEGSTSTVETIRNAALTKIMSGEVKSLVSSSINTKSFSFQVSKPADQIFAEASQAIIAFNGGRYAASEADFSQL